MLVYVKTGLAETKFEPSAAAVVLDQRGCRYDPGVIALQVGQRFEIRNSDATLHNVHSLPSNSRGFNIGMPNKDMSAVRKFEASEVFVRIKCDVHPWMATYVGVVDHPFFAVTQGDGNFELRGLPAGDYTIEAAHPTLGVRTGTVSVADDAPATLAFKFSG